jgi:hypothetical protein
MKEYMAIRIDGPFEGELVALDIADEEADDGYVWVWSDSKSCPVQISENEIPKGEMTYFLAINCWKARVQVLGEHIQKCTDMEKFRRGAVIELEYCRNRLQTMGYDIQAGFQITPIKEM